MFAGQLDCQRRVPTTICKVRIPGPVNRQKNQGSHWSLPTNRSCNEPVAATDIPSEPAGEPFSGMRNAHTTSKLHIDGQLINCLDAAGAFDSYDTDNPPTSAVRAQEQGGNITPVVDVFPVIHGEGFSILDEFFEQPSRADAGVTVNVTADTSGKPLSRITWTV